MIITSEALIRDIAVELPTAIPVLERLGIDYCCGGKNTLVEACTNRNLKLEPVLEELDRQQQQNPTPTEIGWTVAPLREFSEYIINKHHAYTRDQLKLIDGLMTKMEHHHGADHLEIFQVGKAFAVISSTLTRHFDWEETTLFPYIATMETEQQPDLPASSIDLPIALLMAEHDQAGSKFRMLRELTNNYTPPRVACPTWRALYGAMEELEFDLHQHIHLENNILFPRALEQAHVRA